jgi:hypothetical protein
MKKYKQFLAGLIVGAMLFSTVTVFAGTQAIEAFFNNIKLSVDGKVVELKDATGNPVEPFIYNGTTYLPVRAIAEALGMEVKFNETTNTVELAKVKEVLKLENLIEVSPEATASILQQNPEVRDTIDENGYAIWKGKPVRLNKDYLDGKVEAKLQSEVAMDATTENPYDENILTTILEDGAAYVNIKHIAYGKILRFRGYIKAVPNKDSNTVNIYKFAQNNGTLVMENVPIVTNKNDLFVPYDEYKNNILPKLIEALKQNQ